MRYLSLLLLVFLLVSCGTDTASKENTTTETSASEETPGTAQFVKQTIAPPIPDINWPDNSHQIFVKEGGRIELSTGSVIEIPANAFVYPDGQTVDGNVRISMREFHTAAELVLSGIPMRDWDEKEKEWKNFSTAGMFEIRGTDENNQTVEIADGHPLTVHLASRVAGTYDYWYFNETAGDWEKQGQNTPEVFADENNPQAAPAARQNRPVAPRQYDAKKLHITFAGMNLADFPELNDPENIALQYAGKSKAPEDPQENQWIFTEDWYKAEITKTQKAEVYKLYLENDDQEFTTYVQPTLLPKAYASALADYRQKLENYESAMQDMAQSRQNRELLRRSMQVNRFGNYNYDIYGSWQEPVFATATFQLEESENNWNNIDQIYLVTADGRISVRYPRSDWSLFNFDRRRENLLLGITSDARIVLLSPDDFTTQSADLVTNERQQPWNCIVSGRSTEIREPAALQKLIDDYFAS